MSMISFIRQLLFDSSNRSKQQLNTDHDKEKAPCSLEIEMNYDGTINIICSWPEFNEDNKAHLNYLANYYAMMIDALNSGFLNKEIINTIKNYNTDNNMDILFAQNVYYKITELNFLKKEQEKNNSSYIKPSQVFHK
jgi:hypothetical protein